MGTYAMTGGATGIGAAIKSRLQTEGHEVIVIDIKNANIEVGTYLWIENISNNFCFCIHCRTRGQNSTGNNAICG